MCWSGYYKEQKLKEFPAKISAPALRGLIGAKITTLTKLANFSEQQILDLHGVGPTAIPLLRAALKSKGLSFKKEKTK